MSNENPPPSTVSKAKRRLFPAADDGHQPSDNDAAAFVEKALEEILVQQREKWNFDFTNETPVEGGRYEWKGNEMYVNIEE